MKILILLFFLYTLNTECDEQALQDFIARNNLEYYGEKTFGGRNLTLYRCQEGKSLEKMGNMNHIETFCEHGSHYLYSGQYGSSNLFKEEINLKCTDVKGVCATSGLDSKVIDLENKITFQRKANGTLFKCLETNQSVSIMCSPGGTLHIYDKNKTLNPYSSDIMLKIYCNIPCRFGTVIEQYKKTIVPGGWTEPNLTSKLTNYAHRQSFIAYCPDKSVSAENNYSRKIYLECHAGTWLSGITGKSIDKIEQKNLLCVKICSTKDLIKELGKDNAEIKAMPTEKIIEGGIVDAKCKHSNNAKKSLQIKTFRYECNNGTWRRTESMKTAQEAHICREDQKEARKLTKNTSQNEIFWKTVEQLAKNITQNKIFWNETWQLFQEEVELSAKSFFNQVVQSVNKTIQNRTIWEKIKQSTKNIPQDKTFRENARNFFWEEVKQSAKNTTQNEPFWNKARDSFWKKVEQSEKNTTRNKTTWEKARQSFLEEVEQSAKNTSQNKTFWKDRESFWKEIEQLQKNTTQNKTTWEKARQSFLEEVEQSAKNTSQNKTFWKEIEQLQKNTTQNKTTWEKARQSFPEEVEQSQKNITQYEIFWKTVEQLAEKITQNKTFWNETWQLFQEEVELSAKNIPQNETFWKARESFFNQVVQSVNKTIQNRTIWGKLEQSTKNIPQDKTFRENARDFFWEEVKQSEKNTTQNDPFWNEARDSFWKKVEQSEKNINQIEATWEKSRESFWVEVEKRANTILQNKTFWNETRKSFLKAVEQSAKNIPQNKTFWKARESFWNEVVQSVNKTIQNTTIWGKIEQSTKNITNKTFRDYARKLFTIHETNQKTDKPQATNTVKIGKIRMVNLSSSKGFTLPDNEIRSNNK